MTILSSISGPRDLDDLSVLQLKQLAEEIRAFLVENVARTGGHLGPNLGVVELTLALAATSGSTEERHQERVDSTVRHEVLIIAIEAGDAAQAAAAIDAIVAGDLAHTMRRFASPAA